MCTNTVIQYVPKGGSYREVASRCGQTGIHGTRLQCESCEEESRTKYPAGWRYAPGDTCKHGTYLGSHEDNDEIQCGQCESE